MVRILIADDHKVVRETVGYSIQECLQIDLGLAVEVDYVSTGEEAVAKFRTGDYSLLMCDYNFRKNGEANGITGAQAVRSLREAGVKLPIAILSLACENEGPAREAGADVFLKKSGSLDAIVDFVKANLPKVAA